MADHDHFPHIPPLPPADRGRAGPVLEYARPSAAAAAPSQILCEREGDVVRFVTPLDPLSAGSRLRRVLLPFTILLVVVLVLVAIVAVCNFVSSADPSWLTTVLLALLAYWGLVQLVPAEAVIEAGPGGLSLGRRTVLGRRMTSRWPRQQVAGVRAATAYDSWVELLLADGTAHVLTPTRTAGDARWMAGRLVRAMGLSAVNGHGDHPALF